MNLFSNIPAKYMVGWPNKIAYPNVVTVMKAHHNPSPVPFTIVGGNSSGLLCISWKVWEETEER